MKLNFFQQELGFQFHSIVLTATTNSMDISSYSSVSGKMDYSWVLQERDINLQRQPHMTHHKRSSLTHEMHAFYARGTNIPAYKKYASSLSGSSSLRKSSSSHTEWQPSDSIMSNVIERLRKLEGEVFRTQDNHSWGKLKERESASLLQKFSKQLKEFRKIQAKIEEQRSIQIQILKQQIQIVKNAIERTSLGADSNLLNQHHHLKQQDEQRIFTFHQIQSPQPKTKNNKSNTVKCSSIESFQKQIAKINIQIEHIQQNLRKNSLESLNCYQQNSQYQLGSKILPATQAFIVKRQSFISPVNTAQKKLSEPSHQIIYYVDEEGYLLDQQLHYLLNKDSQMIKIKEPELTFLTKS